MKNDQMTDERLNWMKMQMIEMMKVVGEDVSGDYEDNVNGYDNDDGNGNLSNDEEEVNE